MKEWPDYQFLTSLVKQTTTQMNRISNKINHEIMKLFIVKKMAFQTASLKRKEQIVIETKNKVESLVLFMTIFSTFFILMMAVRALIIF